MTREDLIQLAAETLDCEGQCAAGHYIYHDEPTGWWVVAESEMEDLARRVMYATARGGTAEDGVESWCHDVPAREVDLSMVVRDWEITESTDLHSLTHEMIEAGDVVASLVLMFLPDEVMDTIRINAEIDRDHEGEDAQ